MISILDSHAVAVTIRKYLCVLVIKRDCWLCFILDQPKRKSLVEFLRAFFTDCWYL